MQRSHFYGSHDEPEHRHQHGVTDPQIVTTEQGKRAVKWSFLALMATALLQVVVVSLSGSVALLADTLHNFGDAFTALPLWIAFNLARRKPTKRLTYGWGRIEDLAGVLIVLVILASAVAAGYESFVRFFHPRPVKMLWAVGTAALIGFAGNELVARFRIKVGKEIKSAALEADGQHARIDGLTSLCVLFSALGSWLGYPLVDPIVGLLITLAILKIVWDAGKSVFMRLLDGVDPEVVDEIRQTVSGAEGVHDVAEIRVRWIGHQLHAEVNLAVASEISLSAAHQISKNVRHEILHQLPFLSNVVIHVDPLDRSGETFHQIKNHEHSGGPRHSHT
jgi:cation diffusion facilitator family transporter